MNSRPTARPSGRPSSRPSGRPSGKPSSQPSKKPTVKPTSAKANANTSTTGSSSNVHSAQIIGILFGVGAGLVIIYGVYSYMKAKKGDAVDQDENGVEVTNPVHDGDNKDYDDTF